MAINEKIEIVDKEGNVFTLRLLPLEEISPDDFLHVDFHNLYAELITMPVALNRIGNWRSYKNEELRESTLHLEILESNKSEEIRSEFAEKGLKLTEERLKNLVKIDKDVIKLKKKIIKLTKEFEQIDSIFWSAKDKSSKIEKISEKLKPEEFNREILVTKINNVKLRFHGNIDD